jgi:hypothetical protein
MQWLDNRYQLRPKNGEKLNVRYAWRIIHHWWTKYMPD